MEFAVTCSRASATPIVSTARYYLWIAAAVSLELLLHINSEESSWNGCVGHTPLHDTDFCYDLVKLTEKRDGKTAWTVCASFNFSSIRNSTDADALIYMLNETVGDPVWVGGVEAYPEAGYYVSYSGRMQDPDKVADKTGEGCLALHSNQSFDILRYNCKEEFPVLCLFRRFEVQIRNASASDACNNSEAVTLLPLDGCHKKGVCETYRIDINAKSYVTDDVSKINARSSNVTGPITTASHVPRGLAITAEIVLMDAGADGLFQNPSALNTTAEEFCELRTANISTRLRLELRYNMSASGLTLWVGSSGRAAWPPQCVGGYIADVDGDPRALRVVTLTGGDAQPVIWCYAKDILKGTVAVSNSVVNPDIPKADHCVGGISTGGPPPGTVVDTKASCLLCLRKVLHPCPPDNELCTPPCEEVCGPFGLTYEEWTDELDRPENRTEFEYCASDEVCSGNAIWSLTESGDLNNDGVFDCDDRIESLFQENGIDFRNKKVAEIYWSCRKNPTSDFVDLLEGETAVRYHCVDKLNLGRHWAAREILPEISPYVAIPTTSTVAVTLPSATISPISNSSSPTATISSAFVNTSTVSSLTRTDSISTSWSPTTEEPMTRQEVKTTVKRLQHINIKPNANLSLNEMKDIVKDISKLFDVDEETLREVQSEANVSSISQFLETILVMAPDPMNIATSNLAVSKAEASGFQLRSDKPSYGSNTFGSAPRQVPLYSINDVNFDDPQLEAAVILPNMTENVTVAVVTFAKLEDFIPCRRKISSNGVTSANSSTNEKKCIQKQENEVGCINSHVMKVALWGKNKTSLPLPDGEHVKIVLRTKTTPMMGQNKRCVYWNPKEKGWASDGCKLTRDGGKFGLDVCVCNHLTHFAQLVTDGDAVSGPHSSALSIVTAVSCSVSLFAFFGILAAGIFSRKWRKKTENKVMLNLAAAMSFYMALFLRSALAPTIDINVSMCLPPDPPDDLCRASGAALHYFVLSSFCWMLVAAAAHFLRFTRFHGTNSVPRFVLKSAVIGWGAPMIPVAALLAVNAETYAGKGRDFCYPTSIALYTAVVAPICIVLVANVVMFVLIIRQLFPQICLWKQQVGPLPNRFGVNERREQIRKLIVCVAFTFLFGLTWYLGLMSFTVVPAYIFCGVVALQGPALLLFFVFGEENIRNRLKSMKRRFRVHFQEETSGWTGSTNSTDVHVSSSQLSHKTLVSPQPSISSDGCSSDVMLMESATRKNI